MMQWIRNLSLASKLRLMIVNTVVVALLLASVVYTADAVFSLRHNFAQRLITLATAVGENTAAPLKLSNRLLAHNVLTSLRADPDIRAVTLYDAAGRVFADVSLDGKDTIPSERLRPWGIDDPVNDTQPIRFSGLIHAHIQVPVMLDGARLGAIHLDADLTQLYPQLRSSAEFMLFGLLLACLAAYVFSIPLQRRISVPVKDLVRLTRNVLDSKNFSIRADRKHSHELGALTDGFNGILIELDKRDRNLNLYSQEFEKRVRERTVILDQAVAEATEAAKRAEGANRAKSDFLARMSHEIRTPMNGVLGMADLLCHSPALDERQRRYAATIHQSGSALLQIINDILDFSKIEAGKLQLESAQFCLRDIVEDAVEILSERAHSKGLELNCDIPAKMDTTVYGDGLRLRQVLINLISNAVKFTERGEINVKVRQLGSSVFNSSFHFEVTDTGIGIKPENCITIFESFSQEDSSTTRLYGGTGLGLAICKQLVELMGGRISLVSSPGKGSTFFFSLPLATDPTAVRDRRVTALNSTRMLIVDDNSTNRDILREHLLSWGVTVIEASAGAQALEILDKAFGGEFDVIMVDGQMPEMSGAELATAIRNLPEFDDVPIVMMKSGALADSDAGESQHGATVSLSKPIRRLQLHTCLMELLANYSVAEKGGARGRKRGTATAAHIEARKSRVRRVLLVEDNPVNQEVAQAMLQELGVEAVAAWSGEEALELLAADRFEVVFMDCQMPKLDGYATTRRFREWEHEQQRSRTPIVALTANALDGDAEKCFAAGMDRYLSKPFTIDQLYQVLDSYGSDAAAASDPKAAGATEKLASAVLDQRTLAGIRALRRPGAPDLLAKVVGIYASNSCALVEALKTATLSNDAAGLLHAAHALKSSSANVGAAGLAELCRDVEVATQDGDTDLACVLVEQLLAEHKQVLQALDEQSIAA
jgi:two-component system sensor histidine kinase/response regulator